MMLITVLLALLALIAGVAAIARTGSDHYAAWGVVLLAILHLLASLVPVGLR